MILPRSKIFSKAAHTERLCFGFLINKKGFEYDRIF